MNTIKPFIVLALFLINVNTAFCQISQDLSEVIIYAKPDFIAGNLSQVRFKIQESKKELFNLKVNTSEIAMVEPGLRTFTVKNLWKKSFTLDVKPNHKYLVEVKSTLFKPKIRLVSEKENI